MGDSWILLFTKDLKLFLKTKAFFPPCPARQGSKWTAEVSHSPGSHLLMRHLLGHDFLQSETGFRRSRSWLRSAPAAGAWLVDPFHIFLCDSYRGHCAEQFVSKLGVVKRVSNCDAELFYYTSEKNTDFFSPCHYGNRWFLTTYTGKI